ncbi:hypothetical protein, partial [Nocardioides salarius]|uniref:hypothetical protein n=1 Tax=Nocardioides salarius TaxID=374513 RepID=UPI0030FA6BF3
MERRLAELDGLDPSFLDDARGPTHGELYRAGGLGSTPDPSPERRGRRSRGPVLPGLLVAAVLAGLIVARDPGATGTRVRELLGSNERLGEIVG